MWRTRQVWQRDRVTSTSFIFTATISLNSVVVSRTRNLLNQNGATSGFEMRFDIGYIFWYRIPAPWCRGSQPKHASIKPAFCSDRVPFNLLTFGACGANQSTPRVQHKEVFTPSSVRNPNIFIAYKIIYQRFFGTNYYFYFFKNIVEKSGTKKPTW